MFILDQGEKTHPHPHPQLFSQTWTLRCPELLLFSKHCFREATAETAEASNFLCAPRHPCTPALPGPA